MSKKKKKNKAQKAEETKKYDRSDIEAMVKKPDEEEDYEDYLTDEKHEELYTDKETQEQYRIMDELYENSDKERAGYMERISNPVIGHDPVYPYSLNIGRTVKKPPVLMYCPNCGLAIRNEDQSSCPQCGTLFSKHPTEEDTQKKCKKNPGGKGGKTFVLDTNVIIATYGRVFTGLDDNEVVVTMTTFEELDKFKDEKSERGYATREAIRQLKSLKEEFGGDMLSGIPVNNGGLLRMEPDGLDPELLPYGLSLQSPDNRIICAAKSLKRDNPNTLLITNDALMAFKAEAIPDGATVQSYHNDIVVSDTDKPYTGRNIENVRHEDISQLFRQHRIKWGRENATENEYFILKSGMSSAIAKYQDGYMIMIDEKDIKTSYVTPKNAGQKFALDALLAPPDEIPLVILMGSAGSGKTYLSMAAALDQTYTDRRHRKYEEVIITRSNTIPEREDMGFLPGDIKEKMDPLLLPFYQAMKKLLMHGEQEDHQQIMYQMDELMDRYVNIMPLAYIRGINVDNAFLIVDEAQNLTIAQIRTLITRMGSNSKLVLLGDPRQIDTPKLSRNNNGLVYAAEKFKGCPLCAQVTFDPEHECVRSPLSAYAVEVL